MEKATFRLPEWELEEMRARSRRERRSLNAVAVEVIASGLGKAPADDRAAAHAALGKLIVRPRMQRYAGLPAGDPSPVSLLDALDWTRGER